MGQKTKSLSTKPLKTIEGISKKSDGGKKVLAKLHFKDWFYNHQQDFFPEHFWKNGFVIGTYTEYDDGYIDGMETIGIFLYEPNMNIAWEAYKNDFILTTKKNISHGKRRKSIRKRTR